MAQSTVFLGQFTDDNAVRIRMELDAAGIHCWSKTSGKVSRVLFGGNWGTHLFVDEERLEDAKQIAEDIAQL